MSEGIKLVRNRILKTVIILLKGANKNPAVTGGWRGRKFGLYVGGGTMTETETGIDISVTNNSVYACTNYALDLSNITKFTLVVDSNNAASHSAEFLIAPDLNTRAATTYIGGQTGTIEIPIEPGTLDNSTRYYVGIHLTGGIYSISFSELTME